MAHQKIIDTESDGLPQLVRLPVVAQRLGVCERTVLRYVERGEFPRPLLFGRTKFWLTSAVREAIEAREAAANEPTLGSTSG